MRCLNRENKTCHTNRSITNNRRSAFTHSTWLWWSLASLSQPPWVSEGVTWPVSFELLLGLQIMPENSITYKYSTNPLCTLIQIGCFNKCIFFLYMVNVFYIFVILNVRLCVFLLLYIGSLCISTKSLNNSNGRTRIWNWYGRF